MTRGLNRVLLLFGVGKVYRALWDMHSLAHKDGMHLYI